MATTYETCPQNFVYPLLYGLRGSTVDFPFSKAVPHVQDIDFNEHYMFSGGYWELEETSGFWPSNDVDLELCDAGNYLDCSHQPNWSGSQKT